MSSSIDVVVKTINNEIFNYNVGLDSSILSFKSLIRETTNIEEGRQRLIYKGRVLNDEFIVRDCNLDNGQTVHMVARPSNYQQLREQSSSTLVTNQTSAPNAVSALTAALSRVSNPVAATAATTTPLNAINNDSLDHIRQGLLSIHTLISTMDPRDFREPRAGISLESETTRFNGDTDDFPVDIDYQYNMNEKQQQSDYESITELSEEEMELADGFDEGNSINNNQGQNYNIVGNNCPVPTPTRKFFKGQWVDVKDTVSQWLEATVMDINPNESKLFIHYNGWFYISIYPQTNIIYIKLGLKDGMSGFHGIPLEYLHFVLALIILH